MRVCPCPMKGGSTLQGLSFSWCREGDTVFASSATFEALTVIGRREGNGRNAWATGEGREVRERSLGRRGTNMRLEDEKSDSCD
jgi:hypothetical protein